MLVELIHDARFKAVRRLWLKLLQYYFRVEVEGMDYVPSKGGALIVANHSGYSGADALLLGYLIKRGTRRRPRFLAHRAFFDFSRNVKAVSETFGLKKATLEGGVETLAQKRLVIIFPEGESGNFKSSVRRYRLQRFKTGFLRMAIEADVPIIPAIVIGAEESYLNLGNINLSKVVKGLKIPLPINLIPLPAKWKIVFLPPIEPKNLGGREVLADVRKTKLAAYRIQRKLQFELIRRVNRRPYIYSRETRKLALVLKRIIKIRQGRFGAK